MKKGFTLVEMMVAIAVFSIVMVVAMSALLNVIDANKKAQAIKTAINNVNFALESISKDIRVGTGYECLNSSGDVVTCDNNGAYGVRYIAGTKTTAGDDRIINYRFLSATGGAKGKIQRRITAGADDTLWQDMTSLEVDIQKMRFYVLNDDLILTPAVKEQPRIVITLTGEAGTQDKIKTTFDLQTSVSQRARGLLVTTP